MLDEDLNGQINKRRKVDKQNSGSKLAYRKRVVESETDADSDSSLENSANSTVETDDNDNHNEL